MQLNVEPLRTELNSRGGKVPGVEKFPGWKSSWGGKVPGVAKFPGWQKFGVAKFQIGLGWKSSRGGRVPNSLGVAKVRGANCHYHFRVEKFSGWKASRGGKVPSALNTCLHLFIILVKCKVVQCTCIRFCTYILMYLSICEKLSKCKLPHASALF